MGSLKLRFKLNLWEPIRLMRMGMRPCPDRKEPRALPMTAPKAFTGSTAFIACPGVSEVLSLGPGACHNRSSRGGGGCRSSANARHVLKCASRLKARYKSRPLILALSKGKTALRASSEVRVSTARHRFHLGLMRSHSQPESELPACSKNAYHSTRVR